MHRLLAIDETHIKPSLGYRGLRGCDCDGYAIDQPTKAAETIPTFIAFYTIVYRRTPWFYSTFYNFS